MTPNVPHLLVVDDDERIRGLLQKFLIRHGFLVTIARDARQARNLLAGFEFDLIILDVMMPGEDGISLTQDLRGKLSVPIFLLTARGEIGNRIEGLEAGAYDYLVKPFEPKELLLRINVILRRQPTVVAPLVQKSLNLGAVHYDIERAELWQGDKPIRLTLTEAQLMRILAQSPGQAVSREALVGSLSNNHEGQERTVDVQINRLRRKIEQDPREPRYLQTVRGAGYLLKYD